MKKRILSLVLALLMLSSTVLLSACNSSSSGVGKIGKGALTTKTLQNVYKAESVSTLGTVFETLEINRVLQMKDNKLLVRGYTKENYEDKYYITDISFQNATELPVVKSQGENTETYVNNLSVNPQDGSVWYIKNIYTYEQDPTSEILGGADDELVVVPRVETESGFFVAAESVAVDVAVPETLPAGAVSETNEQFLLVKVDTNGNIAYETDITQHLLMQDNNGGYYNGYVSALVFSADKAVLCMENKLVLINTETGAVDQEITLDGETYINETFTGASGTIYFSVWGDKGMQMKTLDLATGKSADAEFALEGDLFNYSFAAGALGYEFLLADSNALYGYNPTDKEPTEICNYTNSDIDLRYGRSTPIVLEDGRLLLSYYDYENRSNEIMLLSKVDPSEVKEKYLITVGGTYINYDIKSALMKFNRTNDEFKVVFKDYSKYNSEENEYKGAGEQLDKDILSGTNAPDIIMLNSYSMDYNNYISKGVFANLDHYMDADETFDRSEYLENVLDAMRINGGLYTFTPTVTFMTLVGKKSIFGDKSSWTMQEFLDMHNSLAEGEQMIAEQSRDSVGDLFLMVAKDEFIEESGQCNFNSDEFKSILAYLKDIPADYSAYEDLWRDNDNYWAEQELSYSKGTTKLRPMYIYNFDAIPETEAYLGEEAAFVGYPTSITGQSGVMINVDTEMAINANSKVTAGAWEVFKYLLSEEYQNKYSGDDENGRYTYAFPLRKSIIEKKMVNDIKPRYYTYTDENGEEVKEEEENTYWIGDQEVTLRKSTEDDVDRLYELIQNAHIVSRMDEKLTDIIMTEAQAYFDGQKSADDVANIINSRVQLMVNERR